MQRSVSGTATHALLDFIGFMMCTQKSSSYTGHNSCGGSNSSTVTLLQRIGWVLFCMGLCGLIVATPASAQSKPKGKPDAQGTNPAAPPEMPDPTVLESASFLIFQDGLVVGDARYKIVRSNFSELIFASGRQRYFSKQLLTEDFQAMKGRERKAMVTSRHMHHFEFKKSGRLSKYKGWTITEKNRQYVLLFPRKSGMTQRIESIGRAKANDLTADPSSLPFNESQIFLLRMVLRKMSGTGEPVLVVNPQTGAAGTVSMSVLADGSTALGGAATGWKILKDPEGHVSGYQFNNHLFQREVRP